MIMCIMGLLVEFGCKVIKSCPRDPLTRQLAEAAKIEGHTGNSVNDKNEWQRPASIRVRGERS